eukprot:TCONS_00000351-protein
MSWLAWSKRIFLLIQLMLLVIKETEARETYCLQKTRLTVFTDVEILFVYSNRYEYPFLVSVIKTVLQDQCYEGRLYDQANRKFIEINDVEDIRSDFEKLSHNFQPIKRDEMYSFVDEFYGEINNNNNDSREIIFYLYEEYKYTLRSYMELKVLSKNPKVSVIIGCLTYLRSYTSEKLFARFPELAWLPIHRFILITSGQNI